MRDYNQLLWSLDNEIQPRDFERLSVDLLGREGYHHIEPSGGTKDNGRDAEVRFWSGASDKFSIIAFQFSLEREWERKRKLFNDATKIADACPNVCAMVFVTSQKVTGATKDKLRNEFKSKYSWDLKIYDREWFRHRLTEFHQDLAEKYFGLKLPPTVCYAVTQLELSGFDEDCAKEIFQHTSSDLVRASVLGSTQKEPFIVAHWHKLAKIEYLLRNYDGALEAVNKGLHLESCDALSRLNMGLLRGAILAEKGIRDQSRPLLVQAKDVFAEAVKRTKREIDHYNLANTLVALGELDEAGKHYARCVELDPGDARAWKNFGSLFIQKRALEWGLECFDNALKADPNLVEAYLSKATALLLFIQNGAEPAIQNFEIAYKIAPELDRKWKYGRYWYSKALMAVSRPEEALIQVEIELALRPDDIHLLNQKASILRTLGQQNTKYEDQALEFLKFRTQALPSDYEGLVDLIDIFNRRGSPEEAWPFIESNLACKPFSLRQIASQAGITTIDMQRGFKYARLYKVYRQRFSVEDHCITLHGYGLVPRTVMLPVLNQALMAPFGMVAHDLRAFGDKVTGANIETIFSSTLKLLTRLFPQFGEHWLAKAKPNDADEQIKLLSTGILYLPDVVIAETARHVAFVAGYYGIQTNVIEEGHKSKWNDVCAEIGIRLMEEVVKQWQMLKIK